MAEDFVFPEDSGTGAPSGDNVDAANFATLRHSSNVTDYVDKGVSLHNVDFGNLTADVGAGLVFVSDTSAQEAQTTETRDQGVTYTVILSERTGVSLTDGAVNHIYVDVNLSNDDDVSLVVNTTGSKPSDPSLKVGEIDTQYDNIRELNRGPTAEFDEIVTHALQDMEPTLDQMEVVSTVKDDEQLADTYWVRMQNGVAYHAPRPSHESSTANNIARITSVDNRDPQNPEILDTVYEPNDKHTDFDILEVAGDHLFASGHHGDEIIASVDISNPSNLEWKDSISGGGAGMNVMGQFLIVAGDSNDLGNGSGVSVIDISDPSDMEVVATVGTTADHPGDLRGDYGFFGSLDDGNFCVIDFSDPYNPQLVTEVDTGYDDAHGVWVDETLAYVTSTFDDSNTTNETANALLIYDIDDPTNPQLIGEVQDDQNLNQAHAGHLFNEDLFLTYNLRSQDSMGGVGFVDVSDPTNPTVIGEFTHDYINKNWHAYPDGRGHLIVAAGSPANRHTVLKLPEMSVPNLSATALDAWQAYIQRAMVNELDAHALRGDFLGTKRGVFGQQMTPPSVATASDLPNNMPEPSVVWVEDEERWYTFTE